MILVCVLTTSIVLGQQIDEALQSAYFEKQVLMENLTDPMEISIAADGTVYLVERGGAILRWDPTAQHSQWAWGEQSANEQLPQQKVISSKESRKKIGYIPVYMIIEDGLLGVALDPDFAANGWLYVFYAPAEGSDSRISRFTVDDDFIDPASEKILMHIPMQREACCHAAGSLAFGPDGTLYIAVGDNTDHIDTAGGPIDERPGHEIADAQLTSGNTNDLRGKILRIKPLPDGSYSIPEGNLFTEDDKHRPEIFAMGLRNPFRISVDAETGWLYFGDVGNGDPPNERGGWGWDEFNQARSPGNFGWPYLTGNNQPYRDFDYATETIGDPFEADRLINDSPNNTGVQALPPALPAMIWYTFGESKEFPEMGAGGVNPMSGPVYRRAASHKEYALPDYYIGKHFIYDWMRNWIQVVSFDAQGDLAGIEPFLPEVKFARPMDMEVGPDGALYIIEWGRGFWGSNRDAKLVRVIYRGTDKPTGWPALDTERNDAKGLSIEMPKNGGFFSFDDPIDYHVAVHDSAVFDMSTLQVEARSGFDTNTFVLDTQEKPAGQFIITREFTHTPDLHFTDRFAELRACIQKAHDQQQSCSTVKLHPYKKEAEHFSEAINASRHTYSVQPAAADFAATALTVMRLKNGGELHYVPMDLSKIEAVKIRYKSVHEATLTIHYAPNDEIARLDLAIEAAEMLPELPQAKVLDRLNATGQGHVIERLERSAYQGWREFTIPVPELGSVDETRRLVVKAQGVEAGTLIEIDALTFIARH